MKEFLKSVLTDVSKDAVNKIIMWVVIFLFSSIFFIVGVIYIKKSTEKQLKKAVIEVKTLDTDELSKRAGETAGEATKDFMEARDSFKKAYLKAKNDTLN